MTLAVNCTRTSFLVAKTWEHLLAHQFCNILFESIFTRNVETLIKFNFQNAEKK